MAEVDDWKGTEQRNSKGIMRIATRMEPEEMETDEKSEEEEKKKRKISQQPVERVISKARKLLMNQWQANDPSDEVRGSYSKPPKEKEELSDWEEEDETPLSQLQK